MKLVLLLLFSVACTNLKTTANKHTIDGQCEDEFKQIHLEKGQGVWEKVSEGSGVTASYLVTGLAYSTDAVVTYIGGSAVAITLCSPFIMLEGMARSADARLTTQCLEEIGGKVIRQFKFDAGENTFKETANWRCPNLDHVATGLLNVAKCYEKKGEAEKAKEQREAISKSDVFNLCLSPKMKTKIQNL